jgi:hypothetical protein
MKRSTRSFAKKASNLYQSIHQQLSVYAGAAVMAVVSVLALTQPSEAKIVYTPTHVYIKSGQNPYSLDLNHDGTTDFIMDQVYFLKNHVCNNRTFESDRLSETPIQGNAAVVATDGSAVPLDRSAEIGPKQSFGFSYGSMALVEQGYFQVGLHECGYVHRTSFYWVNVTNRYLGLEFQINGKTHYGWARLSVQVGYVYIKALVTGYAYETIAGKSIKAGQTKEADNPTNEDFGPSASLTSPIPDAPQPASLGMLALGAQGVPLWRRKESALEGDLKGAV